MKITCNFSQKIDYITANSKLIKKNSIFIIDCYKQIKKKYINEAFNNGAVAILTNKKIKNIKYNQIVVKNLTSSSILLLFIKEKEFIRRRSFCYRLFKIKKRVKTC